MPIVNNLNDFDRLSGNKLERLIFNNRKIVLTICLLVTLALAFKATKLAFNANFEKMIPQGHPYIKNYLTYKKELRGLGNSIKVVVENTKGTIFEPDYLELLQKINDESVLTPGVDRAWVKSIWTPAVRWTEVTEEGYQGGPVMPDTYDGSQKSIEQLKMNIARSGILGTLVAADFKSCLISVPLLERDSSTGKRLDYNEFSKRLEKNIRNRQTDQFRVHIIGFAKLAGDLIDSLMQVIMYFAFAAIIAAIILYRYSRCIRSTLLVLICSLGAVVWQLGIIATFGYDLDPYSILVPFLIFAIGVSHGMQKMNGIMQDIGRGTHRLVAARYTFRRLFIAGLTALLADAVGFAVLMIIDIPVIRELALTASIGVVVLILTNLVTLPVLLSYSGVSQKAALRSLRQEHEEKKGKGLGAFWKFFDRFTEHRWATGAVIVSVVLLAAGFIISLNLKIGDLDPGAPELRTNSRYNRDNAYIIKNYKLSSDQFAVILKTPPDECYKYKALVEADRLSWALQQVPGVQTTHSLVDAVQQATAGSYEGNSKWFIISRSQDVLNSGGQRAATNNPDLFNGDASVMPIIASLSDHKAETLNRVVKVADEFSRKHSTSDRQFMLAVGTAGIEAATNTVVKQANRIMIICVYAAVILLSFITFRSWRAVVVAVLPLILTSILCEALMVMLGIGVKVATLPVIALGVGIGVDYALYLLSVQLTKQRQGELLADAYRHALGFTGKVVGLVGITLAAGVVTWAFSPIKFQADMGILLTFMFLWNMIGALVLIPALSHFLLNMDKKVTIKN